MVKDERYTAVQSLIETGKIQKFGDIFKYLPKTVLARDLKQNYRSVVGKINNPHRFTVQDITRMADLIEITPAKLFDTIIAALPAKKK